MTDTSRQQHDADPAADRARRVAAAAGESVTADRLLTSLTGDPSASERLLDLLGPDEQPHYLLEGLMADRVGRDGERRRRMASPDGAVFTLVTDRTVRVVVQYTDRTACESIPLAAVVGTTLQRAGSETRLGLDTGEERHEVYPSASPHREVAAAAAYIDAWEETNADRDTDESVVAGLERLAGLYERGVLTDEEFAAAKRDLLG